MLELAPTVDVPGPVVDTCGTGGDRAGTINVSTMAAIVAAGAGAVVAKHGNRAASSRCGSADLLEALGVRVGLEPPGVERCLAEAGIGFMFAPVFHAAMAHAAVPRRELGIPTVFNFLDPAALGLAHALPGDLVGGDPSTNAGVAHAVLAGQRGPARDIVVLNAAAALTVAGISSGLPEGLEAAAGSIDSGRAAAVLDTW